MLNINNAEMSVGTDSATVNDEAIQNAQLQTYFRKWNV